MISRYLKKALNNNHVVLVWWAQYLRAFVCCLLSKIHLNRRIAVLLEENEVHNICAFL